MTKASDCDAALWAAIKDLALMQLELSQRLDVLERRLQKQAPSRSEWMEREWEVVALCAKHKVDLKT